MKRKFFLIALSFSLFVFSKEKIIKEPLEKSQDLVLTLEKAQNYAKEHNRTLQNASFDIKQAEAKKWQAIASMLLQINAKYDYANMCGYEMELNMGAQPINISMPSSGTLGLTASMTISGSQLLGASIGILAKQMQDISYKQSEQNVKSQVEQTYMSILTLKETLELLEKSFEDLNVLYSSTAKAVEVGSAEETDAEQISVQVSSLKATVNSTKRNLDILKNSLLLQIGAPSNTELKINQKLYDLFDSEELLGYLSDSFQMNKNYSYKLVKKSTELKKKQLTLSKMNYVPSITGFYRYSNVHYFDAKSGFNMTAPNTIGASISVPIFSSFSNANKVKESRYEYKKSQNEMEDTIDGLKIKNKQLRYNLTSAYEIYKIQKKNMEVTTRVFNKTMKKFKLGVSSSIDVTTANTNLISVQSSYVRSMLDMIQAQIALKDLLNE